MANGAIVFFGRVDRDKTSTTLTRSIHSFLPGYSRTPAELMKSSRIHRIAEVIVRTIFNELEISAHLFLASDSLQLQVVQITDYFQ